MRACLLILVDLVIKLNPNYQLITPGFQCVSTLVITSASLESADCKPEHFCEEDPEDATKSCSPGAASHHRRNAIHKMGVLF